VHLQQSHALLLELSERVSRVRAPLRLLVRVELLLEQLGDLLPELRTELHLVRVELSERVSRVRAPL